MGFKDEAGAAPLADGFQTAARDQLVPDRPSVGIVDKFNQFFPFSKRSSSISTSSTVTHTISPLPIRIFENCIDDTRQGLKAT
jgi:hypothetical protein